MKFKLKGLKRASSPSLAEAFGHIPIDTTTLNLSCNRLFNKEINDLIKFFHLLPSAVTILNLGGNLLGNMATDNLIKLFTAIPENITTLNLRRNNLWHKNANELASVFTALKPNLRRLILGNNNFKNKDISELSTTFRALPQSVTELDLSRSNLNHFSKKKLAQLKGSLPYIHTIILSHHEIEKMTTPQRLALGNIFPNSDKIVFIDKHGKKIAPSLEANLIGSMGLKSEVPSLLQQASFFIAKNKNHDKIKNSTIELTIDAADYVASALSY